MNMNKEKCFKVLQDTCAHYNINNRGTKLTNNNACVYYNASNGNRCAIGRLLSEPQAKYLTSTYKYQDETVRRLITKLDPKVPMEAEILEVLQQYDLEFLCQLQRLHDNHKYWDEDGLNDYGEMFSDEIKWRLYNLPNDK